LPPRLRLTTSSTKPNIHSKGRTHNPRTVHHTTTRGWTESPEAATRMWDPLVSVSSPQRQEVAGFFGHRFSHMHFEKP